MAPSPKQRTWVEISRVALEANVRALTGALRPNTTHCAIVKANAYGHDAHAVVKILLESGVTHFGVDSIDEAFAVRALSEDAVVFILGMVPHASYRDAIAAQFVLNIMDEESLSHAVAEAVALQKIALVNVEIETGLHRLGAMPRAILDLARIMKNNPRSVKLVGISSHLSSAENPHAGPVTDAQYAVLERAVQDFAAYDLVAPYVHIGNSAIAIARPQLHAGMVRTGIALYGLWPDYDFRLAVQRGRAFDLRPVMTWKTTIAQVKDVQSGGAIGYDRSFTTNRPMRIAILPVGYYDGYDRKLSSKGKVLVRGQLCPVVGKICMNMCMVDVSAIAQVKAGDTVTLLGRDGMGSVTADDIAETVGTINYEIVTRINPTIPRIVV